MIRLMKSLREGRASRRDPPRRTSEGVRRWWRGAVLARSYTAWMSNRIPPLSFAYRQEVHPEGNNARQIYADIRRYTLRRQGSA